MLQSRITDAWQTTIPIEVRRALRIASGDTLAYEIRDGLVVLRRVSAGGDASAGTFGSFTEWTDDLDTAYDDL